MILVAALLACAAVAAPSDFEAAVRALARGDTEAHGALLRRAAATGNPAAAYDLATLRLSEGADAEAHALLLAAAEAGHPLAMYAVAMQFRSGVGTTVDLSRYVYWLRQGAERVSCTTCGTILLQSGWPSWFMIRACGTGAAGEPATSNWRRPGRYLRPIGAACRQAPG